MDTEHAQRFLAAAQEDFRRRVRTYQELLDSEPQRAASTGSYEVRQARADVLAAQQVLHLARYEVEHAAEREREQREREDGRIYTCPACGQATSSLSWPAHSERGVCEACYRQQED